MGVVLCPLPDPAQDIANERYLAGVMRCVLLKLCGEASIHETNVVEDVCRLLARQIGVAGCETLTDPTDLAFRQDPGPGQVVLDRRPQFVGVAISHFLTPSRAYIQSLLM